MSKIKVKNVEIPFSENGEFQRRYKNGPATFSSIGDANWFLLRLAGTAPKTGYHKTDFVITWEDGFTYAGRYDLHSSEDRQENPNGRCDLGDHVGSYVRFLSGTRRPAHMTEAQYEACLRGYGMTTERRQGCLDFLANYDLEAA